MPGHHSVQTRQHGSLDPQPGVKAADALGRRLHTAKPQPRVGRIVLTEADYLMFEAIDRHGPFPTPYLYEFTKHLRRDFSHLQNRLTELYNGDSDGPWLVRPPQQFGSYYARCQPLVYDLAPRGRIAAADRGTVTPTSRRRGGPFVHQLMQACVAASFERCTSMHGLRYITRGEILARASKARSVADPLAIPVDAQGTTLVPDDLFGIEYPDKGFRFFALEVDRGTEPIERANPHPTAIAVKIKRYDTIFCRRAYRSHWDIPNLHVLMVTTSQPRVDNILGYVRKSLDTVRIERLAVTYESSFAAIWRVPTSLLSGLFNEERWRRFSEDKTIMF